MHPYHTLYDETEQTMTRFVGFSGDHSRFDVAIITTAHFFGKKLVYLIQSGRTAIMNDEDATQVGFLMDAFHLHDEQEAEELSEFLSSNL